MIDNNKTQTSPHHIRLAYDRYPTVLDGSTFYDIVKEHVTWDNPYTHQEKFVAQADYISGLLPIDARQQIKTFSKIGNEAGYLLVRGLKIENEAAPTAYNLEQLMNRNTFSGELWLSTIASLLGEPFSYQQEGDGYLYHNVVPNQHNHNKLSSQSSSILLDLHTETAFHPFVMDFLLLFCNRNDRDKEAFTIVSSVRKFLALLDGEMIRQLRRKAYRTGIDYSFGSDNGVRGNGPLLSILYGDENDPLLIYDRDLMVGIDQQAADALTAIKDVINSTLDPVYLEPGDLIIVDNRRSVHGRTQFKAYYDGYDRWLQRMYVTKNLSEAEVLFSRRERIISYQFM